jgi:putative mRNA 3-end processing factor
MTQLIELTNRGIYCRAADIYIDPWKPVDSAVITHAHSDHATRGHKKYLSHQLTVPLLKHRLGTKINIRGADYGEVIYHNGVKISLHPAGHIPGSSQVRIESGGKVAVVSGDYKLENDGLTTPFEPVKCNTFVTESTFGLPIYKWRPQEEIFNEINNWWKFNKEKGKASVLFGYSIGKAQRLLFNIDRSIGKLYAYESIAAVNEILINAGLQLPKVETASTAMAAEDFHGSLVIAPSSVLRTSLMKILEPYSTANASGWMAVRSGKRFRSPGAIDRGFALSDHADWDGLIDAVNSTDAEEIYVTHGFAEVFVRWLKENGHNAFELKTMFNGSGEELN